MDIPIANLDEALVRRPQRLAIGELEGIEIDVPRGACDGKNCSVKVVLSAAEGVTDEAHCQSSLEDESRNQRPQQQEANQ